MIAEAYRHCGAMARRHYENFPVASFILPRRLRDPVAAVYAFARTADDLADEGGLPAEARLGALDRYRDQLDAALAGQPPDDPVFIALADTVRRFELPGELFRDLLSAFRQDVTQRRYRDYPELLDYCRRSANPVGRLLLYLQGAASEANLLLSDRVCSALQLANFLQDLTQDFDENDRIYIPLDEMAAAGVEEAHFRERRNDQPMRALFQAQVARTRALMLSGAPLGRRLAGRFGLEIRLIVEGGLAVLERLAAADNPFARPRLRRRDYPLLLLRALRGRSAAPVPPPAPAAGP